MSCVYSGQDEKNDPLQWWKLWFSPPSETRKLSFSILLTFSFESLHLGNNCSLRLEVASSVTFIPSIDHICVLSPHPPKKEKKWHARTLILTSRASRNSTFILASSLTPQPGSLIWISAIFQTAFGRTLPKGMSTYHTESYLWACEPHWRQRTWGGLEFALLCCASQEFMASSWLTCLSIPSLPWYFGWTLL